MSYNLRTLLYILFALPLFFSCEMKKDLFGGEEGTGVETSTENVGLLDLEISAEKEASLPGTKADAEETLDPNQFAISILDSLDQEVKYYASYAALKEEGDLLLPVGIYQIHASLGSDPNAGFDVPYYAGDTTCVISAKEVAKVVTNCTLQNKKIQFEFTEQFRKEFRSDYTIVVDNGLGVLSIPSDETRTAYLKNTGTLRFSVYATTNNNKLCTYTVDMSKDTVVQIHNNVHIKLDADSVNPGTPGDDNNDPGDDGEEPERPDPDPNPGDGDDEGDDNPGDDDNEEPSNPDQTVPSPVLKVDITLIEKDYVFTLPTDFTESKPDVGNGDGGDDDNTGGSGDNTGGNTGGDDNNGSGGDNKPAKPTITGDGFNIDSPVKLTPSNAESTKVRIKISTPGKLASLQVSISSKVLEPLLNELKLGTSFDMCNLTATQKEVLVGLGLSIPSKGVTSTTFDISSFMPLISYLDAGDYKFTIKVTDEAKQTASKTLTVRLSK